MIFHSTFQRKLKRSFSTPYYKTIKLLESNLSLQFLLLCIHYVFTFIKIIFPLCFKHSSSRSPPSINVLSGESSSVVCKYAHFFKRPKLSLIPHILFLLYKLYNPFPLNSQTLKNSSQILFWFHSFLSLLKVDSYSTTAKVVLKVSNSMMLNLKNSFQNWSNLILSGIQYFILPWASIVLHFSGSFISTYLAILCQLLLAVHFPLTGN